MNFLFLVGSTRPALSAFVSGLNAWQFWLILAACLSVVEAATVMLVCIWFVSGALAAALAAFLGASVTVQIILFAIVSLICLAIGWHFRGRLLMQKHKVPTNADRLIGQPALVEETIDLINNTGRVSLKGQSWRALAADDQLIEKGSTVNILAIKGASLIVSPLEQPHLTSVACPSADHTDSKQT